MDKRITITGTIFILISISLGALAAHSLKDLLSDAMITIFDKGVRYQMYMGLGFLAVGLSADKIILPLKYFWLTGVLGVLLFSGCIYIWSFSEIASIPKFIVHLVPFGGLLMIGSWIIFLVKIAKQKRKA